jgi:hypothetical protein
MQNTGEQVQSKRVAITCKGAAALPVDQSAGKISPGKKAKRLSRNAA